MKKIIYGVIFVLFTNNLFAWNSLGHRLVAEIAFQNMDKKTQTLFYNYNDLLNKRGRHYTLTNSAVWMDNLYAKEFKPLRKLHYIDIPFSTDNTKLPKNNHVNAVFAINMANKTLLDKKASKLDKAIASRILLHVVGDIHQPLHSATRISKDYPFGDKGGNFVYLKQNKIAKNLHAYWDRAGGDLIGKKKYSQTDIKKMAASILQKWPCNLDKMDLNPMHWAEESHAIAVNFAYHLPIDSVYQQKTRDICMQRIAISGCRLASLGREYVSK